MTHSFIVRPYRCEEDLEGLTRLRTACWNAGLVDGFPTAVFLNQLLLDGKDGTGDRERSSILWRDRHGDLLASGFIWEADNRLFLFVHPEHPDLTTRLLIWAATRGQEIGRERQQPVRLSVRARDDNPGFIERLRAAGWTRESWHVLHLERSLEEPIPSPQPPGGFTIRQMATRPPYRRLGLCGALLLVGLRRLKEHGAGTAVAGTGSWNEAAQGALASAGFRIGYRALSFSLEISP